MALTTPQPTRPPDFPTVPDPPGMTYSNALLRHKGNQKIVQQLLRLLKTGTLALLTKHFLEPVPAAVVPDYYTVIPPEQAMCLRNVEQSFTASITNKSNEFATVRDVLNSIDLIWRNCFTYNTNLALPIVHHATQVIHEIRQFFSEGMGRSVQHSDIHEYCATCIRDAYNRIAFCDGPCRSVYHETCTSTFPVDEEEEQAWYCDNCAAASGRNAAAASSATKPREFGGVTTQVGAGGSGDAPDAGVDTRSSGAGAARDPATAGDAELVPLQSAQPNNARWSLKRSHEEPDAPAKRLRLEQQNQQLPIHAVKQFELGDVLPEVQWAMLRTLSNAIGPATYHVDRPSSLDESVVRELDCPRLDRRASAMVSHASEADAVNALEGDRDTALGVVARLLAKLRTHGVASDKFPAETIGHLEEVFVGLSTLLSFPDVEIHNLYELGRHVVTMALHCKLPDSMDAEAKRRHSDLQDGINTVLTTNQHVHSRILSDYVIPSFAILFVEAWTHAMSASAAWWNDSASMVLALMEKEVSTSTRAVDRPEPVVLCASVFDPPCMATTVRHAVSIADD